MSDRTQWQDEMVRFERESWEAMKAAADDLAEFWRLYADYLDKCRERQGGFESNHRAFMRSIVRRTCEQMKAVTA